MSPSPTPSMPCPQKRWPSGIPSSPSAPRSIPSSKPPGQTSALARRWKPRSTSIARATRRLRWSLTGPGPGRAVHRLPRQLLRCTPDRGNVVKDSAAFPGLTIEVCEAAGAKCPRCWMHTLEPNAEGLCPAAPRSWRSSPQRSWNPDFPRLHECTSRKRLLPGSVSFKFFVVLCKNQH